MSTAAAQQEVTAFVGVKNGDFVWHELRTTDLEGATSFYTHVVGWKTQGSGDPGGIPYTLLTAEGVPVAGLMQLTPDMLAGGMKPSWAGFIGVDDVDASAKRIEQAGGKLHCPPTDIPHTGRFASAADPQGAMFLIYKSLQTSPPPRPEPGSPGTVGWNELSANDEKSVWPFYSSVFGWNIDSEMDMGPMGIYRMFNNGGARMGAMMTRDPNNSPVPFWLFYLSVEDIDAAAARAQEKQGQLLMGPHEVPGGQWIVLALDPQGALFSLVGSRKK
jgi:uncharacterized protein